MSEEAPVHLGIGTFLVPIRSPSLLVETGQPASVSSCQMRVNRFCFRQPQKQCKTLSSCPQTWPLSSGSPLSGVFVPMSTQSLHRCECGPYSGFLGPTLYLCHGRGRKVLTWWTNDPWLDPGKGIFPGSVSEGLGS